MDYREALLLSINRQLTKIMTGKGSCHDIASCGLQINICKAKGASWYLNLA